jgi:hypothetical protein
MNSGTYVLISAARNEGAYIAGTIRSVTGQSIPPVKWIIVSDGSTDETDAIVREHSRQHGWIQLLRRERREENAGFASKVRALREACAHFGDVDYSYLGNVDADVSFEGRYYESVLSKFAQNAKLGIAGGFIHENHGHGFRSRPTNTSRSVAGAIQMFRRECFEGIGGLVPARLGGEDWIAEVMARMQGWEVESFDQLKVLHHKSGGLTRGMSRERIRQGAADYSLGTHPLFEVLKCAKRIGEKPYLSGAMLRMASYLVSCARNDERSVSKELVAFLRKEQISRIRSFLRSGRP